MILQGKNKNIIKIVLLLEAVLLPSVLVFWVVLGKVWTSFDFQILDFFYAQAVQYGYGPPRSSQIAYITITDDTYAKFGIRLLDLMEMAPVNEGLVHLRPAAGAYGLVFPLPMTPRGEPAFAAS